MSTPFSPLARMIARLCVIMLVLCSAGSAVAQDQAPDQKTKFTRRPAPKGKPVVYSKTLAPASPAVTAPAAHPTRPVRPARVNDADNMAAPASPAEAPRVGEAPLKATPAPATRKPAPPVRKRTVDPGGTEAPVVPAPPAEPQR